MKKTNDADTANSDHSAQAYEFLPAPLPFKRKLKQLGNEGAAGTRE